MTALSFLFHLFMNSTICLYRYGLMGICFIFGIKIQCYFISLLKLLQLQLQELFLLACVPLINPHQCGCVLFWVLSTFLLSGTIRCSRLILHNPCKITRMCHFSKDPQFLLLENGIRNHDLRNKYNHFLDCHAQLTEQGNVCMYLCLFTAALYSIVCMRQILLNQFP